MHIRQTVTNGYTRVLYFPTCQRDSKALRKDICRSFRFVKYTEQLRIRKIILLPTPDVETLSGVANHRRRTAEFCKNSILSWSSRKF